MRLASETVPFRLLRLSVVYALVALAATWLTVSAFQAQSRAPGSALWPTVFDVAVGLAFLLAGALAPGARRERLLFAAVGVLWMVGSLFPEARVAHQTALALALIGFPSGRPTGAVSWLLIGLALPIALGSIGQSWAALLFASIGLAALLSRSGGAYPGTSAIVVAVVLGGSAWMSRIDTIFFNPSLSLRVYQVTLLLVAAGFPLAARAVIASRARLADQILGDQALTGLKGLEAVLADALRDPSLRVYRRHGPDSKYDDELGHRDSARNQKRLEVMEGESTIAVIEHDSAALDDPSAAAAVAAAVRLAAQRLHLEEELRGQLAELESARARLVAATDRQRAGMAEELRENVVTLLRATTSELESTLHEIEGGPAADAVRIVIHELEEAADDVLGLVSGVPPTRLGHGRLGDAIRALAERSGANFTLTVASTAAFDEVDVETTLYYVCSEALTNAVKHAGASSIEIVLAGDENRITLTVSDDGCGGADASGSGLQGLTDRLAARGGRFRVDSPPGTGTTVTATMPR